MNISTEVKRMTVDKGNVDAICKHPRRHKLVRGSAALPQPIVLNRSGVRSVP